VSTPAAPAFFDPGNPLLAQVPVQLDAGTVTGAGPDPVAILTIRTASTTLSVLLGAEELGKWSEIISGLHASLNGGGSSRRVQAASVADVMQLTQNGVKPPVVA
jgi:hypothetical protein